MGEIPISSCPQCGNQTEWRATAAGHVMCLGGCGNTWNVEDLNGERFAFLQSALHPAAPAPELAPSADAGVPS
jgi:hypothetical protein